VETLDRFEQLRDPLGFPIRELLLCDRVPEFSGLSFAAFYVQEKDR
jgi:hypothetical protein